MQKVVKNISNGLNGEITIPSDKSISHRAVMFASLANGKSVIKNFSKGQDPLSSLNVCKSLGIEAEFKNDLLIINSSGKFSAPQHKLDCGNSGTTMRLMSGILAGQNFNSTLTGDESLSKRPMRRVIEPLSLMGADIKSSDFKAPLNISGKILHSIDYVSKLASAQVKSCILLAGLNAEGKTSFTEPYVSRNHTEIMLRYMGANINTYKNTVTIEKSELEPETIEICGDISSAAFFIAAGLIVPNSKIILKNVGLNPTRTGITDVYTKMGADITFSNEMSVCGEATADITVRYSKLKGTVIGGDIIPRLIDEIPIIAVAACFAQGTTIIKDAQELKVKESNRIKTVVEELTKLGADIKETDDGMIINGTGSLKGAVTESHNDHRIAMACAVAGLVADGKTQINNSQCVDISFPGYFELLESLM